jgi:cobalt-zinc-cadmium efflux system membrane fusion protein
MLGGDRSAVFGIRPSGGRFPSSIDPPHTVGFLDDSWSQDCESSPMISRPVIGAFFCLLLSGCGGRSSANQAATLTASSSSTARRIGDTIELSPDSPQLKRIQVGDVRAEGVPVDEVIAPGRIEANPNRISKIALPVAGRIRSVLVGLGDSVREGQPIILIESSEVSTAQSAYRRAEADVSQAQAALAKADADLQRTRDLFQNKAIAQKEVIASESESARTKAALAQAEATREEILQRIRILGIQPGGMDQAVVVRATVSGKVVDIGVTSGEYRNDTNQPVMTLADLSTVWVAADVPESAIRLIRIGEPVTITMPAFPDRTFSGWVKKTGDTVDPETRTIKVRAELQNPQGQFRPEMFAQIRSDHGTRELSTIPKTALLQEEGRSIVYVERAPGRFQEVPVTVASQGSDRIAIADGVHPGDRVVTGGAMLLRAAVP